MENDPIMKQAIDYLYCGLDIGNIQEKNLF